MAYGKLLSDRCAAEEGTWEKIDDDCESLEHIIHNALSGTLSSSQILSHRANWDYLVNVVLREDRFFPVKPHFDGVSWVIYADSIKTGKNCKKHLVNTKVRAGMRSRL